MKRQKKKLPEGPGTWRLRYIEAELTIARAASQLAELEGRIIEYEERVRQCEEIVKGERVMRDSWNRYRKALNIIGMDPGYCGEIARDAIDPRNELTDRRIDG